MKHFLSLCLAIWLGGMVGGGLALGVTALGATGWTVLPALAVGILLGVKFYRFVLARLNAA